MQLTCPGRYFNTFMDSVRHGCGRTLTAGILGKSHSENATYLQAASRPARQVLASKKRRFSQEAKQWIVEKATNVKTKAAALFSCLAPKAAE